MLLVFFFGKSQETTETTFPQDFFGIYTGTLNIYAAKATQEIPMEFHLLPTEINEQYIYKLVYGEGEQRQERDYLLQPKDADLGIYEVDEQNGIILENRVVGNKMYTLFEVQESLLTTFITFEKDHLLFEIVYSDTSKKETSGGQEEDVPVVTSYPISVVQKAYLIKQ